MSSSVCGFLTLRDPLTMETERRTLVQQALNRVDGIGGYTAAELEALAEMRAPRSRRALSPEQVRLIRDRRRLGERLSIIASDYLVSESTISAVARGQRYREVA